MILSALVHRREGKKRFKDNTREIERKTLWLQRFSVCLPPCMDFQKRATVSFDTDFKSDSMEEETLCAKKTLKGFWIFSGAPVQPPTAVCIHVGSFLRGGTCPFHSRRRAPTQLSFFFFFLLWCIPLLSLYKKKRKRKEKKKHINVSHEMLCPWRLTSSHLSVHAKFDNFYAFFWGVFLHFFFFLSGRVFCQ